MRTLLLLERQLSPPLDNISSYIGFTEHIYPSFGPEAFGLEIRFSIIFNEEKFQTSSPTTSFLHRLSGPRSPLCARLQLLQSIICDQNSSRESLFDQNLLVLKFTWKPLWWQLRVDAIVFANGIYRWIVANAISVKLPNLSKIVWTRLNLNAETSQSLWISKLVKLCCYRAAGPNICEWTNFWNQIQDQSLYKCFWTQLEPLYQFWIWSKPLPSKTPSNMFVIQMSLKNAHTQLFRSFCRSRCNFDKSLLTFHRLPFQT